MISARKAKHLDATTMFTYSHANTPLSQSERAYYLGYFINVNLNAILMAIKYVLKRLTFSSSLNFDDGLSVGGALLSCVDEVANAFGFVNVGVISVVATALLPSLTFSSALNFDNGLSVGGAVLRCVDEVGNAFGFVEVGVISVVATTFAVSFSKYDVTKSVMRFKKVK